MALTAKQNIFIVEYLIDLNATQAAVRAGYSNKNAFKIGSDLLQKTTIQQAIKEQMEAREKRTLITADRVLNEIAKIAFASGSDFAKVVEKTGYKPLYNEEGKKIGEEQYSYQSVQLSNTDELDNDKKAAISCIKETKFGIAVESCDKVKALELLGKHLKLFTDKTELTGENAGPLKIKVTITDE